MGGVLRPQGRTQVWGLAEDVCVLLSLFLGLSSRSDSWWYSGELYVVLGVKLGFDLMQGK